MKLKEKNKIIFNKLSIVICFLVVLAISGYFYFNPSIAFALINYNPSKDISLGINTYTQAAGGNFVPDNLIRVIKTSTSAQIQAELTLGKPDAGLQIGTDQIYAGSVGNLKILGVGAGLDTLDSNGISSSCNTTTSSGGGETFNYTSCNLKDGTKIADESFAANAPTKVLVTLNFNKYSTIDVNNTSSPQKLVIYPYILIDQINQIKPYLVFPNSAITLYIQFYNDQAAVDAAITSGQRPSGVPNYSGPVAPTLSGGQISQTNNGNALLSLINEIISTILGLIQELIYVVFSLLIAPLIEALLRIHPYTDSFVAIIYPGWVVVRNICNIFFILALIVIALATLLRVESYQYRHLLVQLIIAALLINFSLVIGQSILGLADTVQGQFLGNNITQVRTLAGNLMLRSNSSVINYFNSSQNLNAQANNNTIFSGIIQSIFWLALSTGTFAVFLAICAFLFIRIVALWILLLVSPIAYACGVLPSTASYRGKWWQEFLKYAFFTPIMAFFLNMAAIMASNAQQNPIFAQVLNGTSGLTTGAGAIGANLGGLIVNVGSDVLLLVFLLVSLKAAEQAGVYGASGITSLAQKGIMAPFAGAQFLAKAGGGYIQKRYNNATAKLAEGGVASKALYSALHAPSTFKAFRKDSSEELERSKALTAAAALSIKRQVPYFKRKGEDPLALYNEHKGKELLEERRGESTDTEEDEVNFGLELLDEAAKGDQDAKLMIPEQLRRMVKNHNINEFTERFGAKYLGLQKGELKYKKENLIGMLDKIQSMGGMSEHVNIDLQKRLGKFGYETGDHTASELTYNDHGHARTIETEFDAAKKSFVVKGQAEYDSIHESAMLTAVDQADYDAKIAAAEATASPDYFNAKKNVEKIMENRINLSKKNDQGQMTQWWESMVSKDSKGNPVLGISGGHVFTHLTSGHEFLATRGNPSGKILEIYMPLVKNSVQLRQELEKAIKQDAFAKGRKIGDLKLEVDLREYQNLRVAALIEKDLSLTQIQAKEYEMVDASNKPIETSDPNYGTELQTRINNLRAILKK